MMLPIYLYLLLSYFGYIAIPTQISPKYETDNDSYWITSSQFKPSRGSTYGGIKRHKSMYFELQFTFHGKTNNQWESILRIGEYGNGTDPGCDEHGNRYPGLFILPSKSKPELQISLSDKTECWFVIEKHYPLQIGLLYHLIIEYNQTYSTVNISATNTATNTIIEPFHLISNRSRTNDDSLLEKFMDIIISDPLTNPANVTISYLHIISYNDSFPV